MLKLSSSIKLVVSDFDGVFTDGCFYIDENLNQTKKLNFKDIMGVFLLLRAGYKFAIVTGEDNKILDYFKIKLGVEEIHKGIRKKDLILKEIMQKYDVKYEEVLYIGDDINDIPAFELVKYKIATNDANYKVKNIENIQITENKGGSGAIREVVDSLLSVEDEKIY